MLDKIEDKNRNGQIKLSIQINFPANALQNKKSPIHLPQKRSPIVQREPKSRQIKMVCWIVLLIFLLSFLLSVSETTGRIITETELVKTVGNVTTERAIPVSTPYTLRASDWE